ncbi:hypothetical protein GCM10022295_92190 [Streptomyces osmaniensis]|uniref:Transposase IS701-like DDE domain-containing protein n=1 Tax=Streptomyces osmaniensis TaxID=593134 RepID=A0ABP6Z336_9ACTN|nr:hypothetical protein KJK32_46515 [Streptomyces sp. JCM17656]
MLMELEDVNCWSLSAAICERGPHRLHHLLSRAVWDEQEVLERTALWAVNLLDDGCRSVPGTGCGRVRDRKAYVTTTGR